MDPFDAAEMIKAAWLQRDDAGDSLAVRLVACPYCGKADRVRELSREEISGSNPALEQAWQALAQSGQPALCGFCLNVVLLAGEAALPPA